MITRLPTIHYPELTEDAAADWQAEQAATVALYRHWGELRCEQLARYSARIRAIDPTLPVEGTMHYAHNWHIAGGPAWDMLQRYYEANGRLYRAYKYASARLPHPYHVARGEIGRYAWCDGCRPHLNDYNRTHRGWL